jgi:ribonuclease P protein component
VGAAYRLRGTGVFDTLFREGARTEGHWLQLGAAPARTAPGRVGYVVGKKALSRAVDRNRVRRVLRVAVAAARPAIETHDVILRLKRGCTAAEVRAVATEAAALLAALARAHGGAR